LELEDKLKHAKKQSGGHVSEHEAGVENQNLHREVEAKNEHIHSSEKRIKELEGQIHHLEVTIHQQKDTIEH